MRNEIPEIIFYTVGSLKESRILNGYDLVFLEKKPIWEEESGESVSERGYVTLTSKRNKVVAIVLFRDYEIFQIIDSETVIHRLLPSLYQDEPVFGHQQKVLLFETFGNEGIFLELSEDLSDIKSALYLTHYDEGVDEWVWLTISNPDGKQAMVLVHYRHCPQCDCYFAVDHELQKYCDDKCRRAMYIEQRRKRLLEGKKPNNYPEVRCQHCGGIFEPKREHAKYCGARCRMADYRRRKKNL